MENDNITWVDLDKGLPSVTIARYGITFNSSATEIINKYEIARVGYQKADKTLVIAMANLEDMDIGDGNVPDGWFPIKDKITSHGYFRLNNKDLVRVIAKYAALNLGRKNRFMAEWDESKKYLVADLTREIEKSKKTKKEKDIYDTLLDLIY